MRPSSLLPALLSLLNLSSASPEPQLAQGGGLAATTLAATQYPIVTTVASLLTVGGTTSTTYIVYTQTFAATALGSWPIGATPLSGAIGLGTIQGQVGQVETKAKRAFETPAPRANGWSLWGKRGSDIA